MRIDLEYNDNEFTCEGSVQKAEMGRGYEVENFRASLDGSEITDKKLLAKLEEKFYLAWESEKI